MARHAGWAPAAIIVALVAPAQVSLAQAPAAERSASEKAHAPRVLLIAGEDGGEDDSEITASAFAHLLADRHGMKTSQVRAHSTEIGRAADALAEADVAVFFVRFRTWPEPEQKRVDAFVARGGKLIELASKDFGNETERRDGVRAVLASLDRKSPEPIDAAPPVATPLTNFDVSTAYVSDWSLPIAKQVFPPEEGIGGFNDVQWIPVKSADGSLDLRRFDPTSKQGTIYVKSKLAVKGKRDLELVLQSDDGLEVFVDGKKLASRQEVRTLHSGCDLVPVTLEDGEHELLLKVVNAGDAWAVRARVRDLTAYRAEKPK